MNTSHDPPNPAEAMRRLDELPFVLEDLARSGDPTRLRDVVTDTEAALEALRHNHVGAALVPVEPEEPVPQNGHAKRKRTRLLKRK